MRSSVEAHQAASLAATWEGARKAINIYNNKTSTENGINERKSSICRSHMLMDEEGRLKFGQSAAAVRFGDQHHRGMVAFAGMHK